MNKAIFVLTMLFILFFSVFLPVHAEDTSRAITSDDSETQLENFTNATYDYESNESTTDKDSSELIIHET